MRSSEHSDFTIAIKFNYFVFQSTFHGSLRAKRSNLDDKIAAAPSALRNDYNDHFFELSCVEMRTGESIHASTELSMNGLTACRAELISGSLPYPNSKQVRDDMEN